MRKITMLGALGAVLAFAPAAQAAPIDEVFTGAPGGGLTCTDPGGQNAGQRWCGTSANQGQQQGTAPSTVPSFDGAPIDATVALPPAPATGPDGNFPVVGIYHGYGGFKASLGSAAAQRWLAQGYAVFTMTDRGFWGSCGVLVPSPKPAACANAYIHLMDNAWEVRDAQHLMGMLADDGAIDPQRIGATGGSYGGGMSAQLGALKNRTQRADGSIVPWTSPAKGLPMQIAATAPEFGWSDLAQSLVPNGSGLDYAARNPYAGPAGDGRFGVMKNIWNLALYGGGQQTGTYAPLFADATANITIWLETNRTGGPYDRTPYVLEQLAALPRHGSYGTDGSVAPAPALLSNGWNDDLFPVDEALRYYNKVRADHPATPISMFHLDFGHANRAPASAAAAERAALAAAEDAWFAKYVRGDGPTPDDAVGGVTVATSACDATPVETYRAKNWASLAQGEVRLAGADARTVAPNTQPVTIFSPSTPGGAAPTVCTSGPDTDTTGAAVYETAPAPTGGYTIAGAPTILADLSIEKANDAVIGRLLDVDPAGTQRLIARGTYRPTGPGTSRQVFQLHPQAWKVQAGHTVKLELLGADQPYALAQTGQAPYGVKDLELRLPTIDAPGAGGGVVQSPAPKVLPRGYELAADLPKPPAPAPGPGPAPAPAPAPTPAPVPAPAATPAPRDPVTAVAATAALKVPLAKATLTKSLRTLRFRTKLPEAGTATFTVTMRVKGKDRVLGTSRRRVTRANTIVVTIKPSSTGRALLRAHPRTALRVRTSFVTAVERQTVVTTRTLRRR